MNQINAYLDTCIISGIVNRDLKQEQEKAVLKLLELRKNGIVYIVTSKVAKDEIDRIPEAYRYQHETIYLLLSDVPICAICDIYGRGLMGMGTGAGKRRLNPTYKSLIGLLPDEPDANHIYQASKNGIGYFLTSDEKTILKHSNKINEICGVIATNPVEFLKIVNSSL